MQRIRQLRTLRRNVKRRKPSLRRSIQRQPPPQQRASLLLQMVKVRTERKFRESRNSRSRRNSRIRHGSLLLCGPRSASPGKKRVGCHTAQSSNAGSSLSADGVHPSCAPTAHQQQILKVRKPYSRTTPIVPSQISTSSGHRLTGSFVLRSPNACPPCAYRCISTGTPAFFNPT